MIRRRLVRSSALACLVSLFLLPAFSESTAVASIRAAATLQSIAVTPTTASLAVGKTKQFIATGTYSDGSKKNITRTVTWTSSNTSVATVSVGLATAVASGSATLTATSGTISGSANLTVTGGAVLNSISLSPTNPTIGLGSNQQFTATGHYSDGSTQDLTTTVNWTSGTQSVATISNTAGSQGLATAVGGGTTLISAADGSISSSTDLTVSSGTTQTWTLHGPPGRHSHTAVFDPNTQQMIIFGGQAVGTNAYLNDVWLGTTATTQDDSFTGETPSGTLPPGRYGHVATYDSTNNRMTIFGGSTGTNTCANDVWVLTGANGQSGTPAWSSVATSAQPPSDRVYSGGAYDPNSNSLIVFGGSNCASGYLNDVWVLSNANGQGGTAVWTQLNPSGAAPQARESGTAVYDASANTLTIYGGDAGGSPFDDVWILSNANGNGGTPSWKQASPSGTAPAARTGHSATYDSATDRMTIFGGTTGSTTLADAWVLTNASGTGGTPAWQKITTTGTAPSVSYHSAAYSASKNELYVFAGESSQDKLQANNHAFTLNGANGTTTGQKWTLGGPPVRYSHSSFYDASTNSLFVFAGQHAVGAVNFNDYWMESGVIGTTNIKWTTLTTSGTRPSPRWGHTGLYDSVNDRMMIFGGATGFPTPCVNAYYVLEHANNQGGTPTWLTITPIGTAPAVRTRHMSAYDSNTNTLIIFGGWNCQSTYYNDVWVMQNANDLGGQPTWTQLSPSGTAPSPRESSSAIYDPTTNSLIVFGGDAGSTPFGDMWILSNANGTGGTPTWSHFNPSNNGPSARSGQTATYDVVNNIMTIYGGYDGTNILQDAWVLTGANGQGGSATWTQLPAGQPRRFHTSNYDPSSNQMITFGGASGVSPQAPSADMYTLTDANNK
jgi:hypothetical protein